jgi:hypothetical protein
MKGHSWLIGIPGQRLRQWWQVAVFHFHGRKTASVGKKLMRSYMIGSGTLLAKHGLWHPNLGRPFWWDLKSATKEITGTNTCSPGLGFSHRDKVAGVVREASRYWLTCKNRVHDTTRG